MKLSKLIPLLCFPFLINGCAQDDYYILNEKNFFLVMTNVQYYPEQYVGRTLEYDCFTYKITDINNITYMCGVRKCSSGYGCTCGNDTIIGFLLKSEATLPEPINQSADTNDKTWIHLKGTLISPDKIDIVIHPTKEDGTLDISATEKIPFLTYRVDDFNLISDYSDLNYYVTK